MVWVVLLQVVLAVLVALAPEVLLGVAGAIVLVIVVSWSFVGVPPWKKPGVTREVDEPLPALWLALMVTFAAMTLDVQGLFTHRSDAGASPYRWAILPIPLIVVFLCRRPHGRRVSLQPADAFLIVLVTWGLVASVGAKLLANPMFTGLSFFIPMCLALLFLVPRGGAPTEAGAARVLDWLAYIGAGFVAIHLAAHLNVSFIPEGAHGHEKAFLLATGVAAAVATQRRRLAFAEGVAILAVFLLSPAATYVMTGAGIVVTVLLLSKKKSRFRTAFIAAMVPATLIFGFTSALNSESDSFVNRLLPRYFEAVGKDDNSAFRREMLETGIEQVRARPLVGQRFTGGFALPTSFRAGRAQVLPHNDFLEIALAGGLLGLFLFLGVAGFMNLVAIRQYTQLGNAGCPMQQALVGTLIVGFNACLSVALFQPVLFEVGTGAMFFLLCACVRATANRTADVSPALSAA